MKKYSELSPYQRTTVKGVVIILVIALVLLGSIVGYSQWTKTKDRATWGTFPAITATVGDDSTTVPLYTGTDLNGDEHGDKVSTILPLAADQTMTLSLPSSLSEGSVLLIVLRQGEKEPVVQQQAFPAGEGSTITVPGADQEGRALLGVEVQAVPVVKLADGAEDILNGSWSVKTSEDVADPSPRSEIPPSPTSSAPGSVTPGDSPHGSSSSGSEGGEGNASGQ